MINVRNPFSPDNYPTREAALAAMHLKLDDCTVMQLSNIALRRNGYEKLADELFLPVYNTWMMALADMCAATLIPEESCTPDDFDDYDDDDELDYEFVFPQKSL